MEESARSVGEIAADLTVDELRSFGRSLREQVPRTSLAAWTPAHDRLDPIEFLVASNRDRLPNVAPIRIGRMITDPFAYLRGSAGAMAADIGPMPVTGIRAQICGDAHLMNFGLFATTERHLVFDLNDFDETIEGAWEWDVQRLAASLEVAARCRGFASGAGAEAVRTMSSTYRRRLSELSQLSELERRYLRIDVDDVLAGLRASNEHSLNVDRLDKRIAKVRSKDRFHALDRFTDVVDGHRVIVDDPPTVQRLDAGAHRDELLALFDGDVASLPSHVERLLHRYRFVDIALKVVGVGSVGTRALMVLLEGKADLDPLFLQIKESVPSVYADHVAGPAHTSQSRRVVEGQRLMQAAGDMFLGWGAAGGRDYFVRQLRDMKGSAELANMDAAALVEYAQLCALALANAHSRSCHPALLSGYLGKSEKFDEVLATFAGAYADQMERDHASLERAVLDGKIDAVMA